MQNNDAEPVETSHMTGLTLSSVVGHRPAWPAPPRNWKPSLVQHAETRD